VYKRQTAAGLLRGSLNKGFHAIAVATGTEDATDPRVPGEVGTIDRIKARAAEKRKVYSEKFRARRELNARHKAEIEELKTKHRAAREEFAGSDQAKESSSEERKNFFRAQRAEMQELKDRQRKERIALSPESKP